MAVANEEKDDSLLVTGENHTHILSKLSRTLDRDTFIFRPGAPARLLVGVNQRLTHMTSSALHRWLRLVIPGMPYAELQPVSVRKWGILRYAVTPSGETVAATDTIPIPAGDYGLFLKSPVPSSFAAIGGVSIPPGVSFEFHLRFNEEHFYHRAPRLELYTFPLSVEQDVRLRDQACFITGAASDGDLDISWVFPPTWAYLLDSWPSPNTCDYTPFITASNACMMRRDLSGFFHDNAFGIDVDDNYRIVVFRDLGPVKLPLHIAKSQNPACMGPDDRFLREHFSWCIKANLSGGDISEDYESNEIISLMGELGVSGEAELAPIDDERWNTVIGKELWELVLTQKLYLAEDELTSDENDQVPQEDSAPWNASSFGADGV